jgi:hypothetical protein
MVAVAADLGRMPSDQSAALKALLAHEFRPDRYEGELIDGRHWRIATVVVQVGDVSRVCCSECRPDSRPTRV